MTLVLGCLLGSGLVLILAPFLWPARSVAERSGVGERTRVRLVQGGLPSVPVPAFLALSVIVGVASAALVHGIFAVLALSAVAGLAGLLLPWLIVSWRAAARRRANRTV